MRQSFHRRGRQAHVLPDGRRRRDDKPFPRLFCANGRRQGKHTEQKPCSRSTTKPAHAVRLPAARRRSSSPIINKGQTIVASLNTSANRPPSPGGTNLPQEIPS